jgi:hypothetical protein
MYFLLFIFKLDFAGEDGWGGVAYLGTGCFHRREVLCGRPYSKGYKEDWSKGVVRRSEETISDLEERAQSLATCTYEINTQWGNGVLSFSLALNLPLQGSDNIFG